MLDSVKFLKVLLGQTTTPVSTFPTLCDKCVGSLTSPTNQYREDTGDGAYGFSFLSENTRMFNRLQISQQRQHILLSYFKTLSVGPVWVLNPNLPHSSPALTRAYQAAGIRDSLYNADGRCQLYITPHYYRSKLQLGKNAFQLELCHQEYRSSDGRAYLRSKVFSQIYRQSA